MSYDDQGQPANNDPYSYQDPSQYDPSQGYTGYESGSYENQGYDNSGYAPTPPPQEQPPTRPQLQQLQKNMYNSFGWNIQTYEDNGNIIVLDAISSRLGLSSAERFVVPRPFTLESLLYEIQTAIQTVNARRVVIDSLDAMSLELTQVDLRSLIQRLTMILKSFGCTTLLVSGQADTTNQGRKAVEEYVVDGMIRLHHSLEESTSGETTLEQNALQGNSLEEDSFSMKMRSRKIEVPKMRGTTHSNFLHPFIIGQDGIEVKAEPENETFEESHLQG